jgi:PKD repeat protein/glucose/arabinose dehydrogenase
MAMKKHYLTGKNTLFRVLASLNKLSSSLVNQNLFIAILVVLFTATKVTSQLPTDFQKVDLLTGLSNATTMQFAPDGRIFILDRYGEVLIYKTDTQTSVSAGEIDVFNDNEDGLLGLAFDPNFETNGYLYLYHSPAAYLGNRVSRFTVNGDDLDLLSEVILLEWPTSRTANFHSGGDMAFDSQGNLYIATGDNNTYPNGYAPLNENNSDISSEKSSSNTNDLRGKILRITPQADGTYTIPNGNLFPEGTANTRPEIYVMGVRNPYRILVDQNRNDWLFWGDVGPDADAASVLGPIGADEVNLAKQAGNYGWPYFLGTDNTAYQISYANPPYYNDASSPQNISTWNTGLTNLPPAEPALLQLSNTAIFSGPSYYFDSTLTDLQRFPADFDGIYFYYDFNRSWIWAVTLDANGNIVSNDRFAPSVFSQTTDGFIDMEFGSDGKLYILAYGAGCCPENVGTGRLLRVDYTGITSNSPPQVAISADTNNGSLPLTVNFSSAGTVDPNGDAPLTYEWDFDGDGIVDSTDENPTNVYTVAGDFNVQLRVDDGNTNGVGVNNITIYAGNNATDFTFNSPPDGGLFNWGDDIDADITATDVEDGTIACDDINVLPALGHIGHFHNGASVDGCPKTLRIDPVAHETDQDIFYVLNADYTDSGGLQVFDQIVLHPKRKEAEFYDSESGTTIIENTDAFEGGLEAIRVDDNGYISLSGRNLANITSVLYRVASSEDGGTIEMRLGSPTGTVVSTTNVPNTGSLNSWVNVVSPFTDPGGKNDLYFVFTGGAGQQDIFDLNYIEFIGAGVSIDNSPPVVEEVLATTDTQLQIKFNEDVTQITAEDIANYSIDNGITVTAAQLQVDDRTVFLTVSELTSDTAYNLTISGVQNNAGLTVVTDSYPFLIFTEIRINSGDGQLNTSYGLFSTDQYASGGSIFNNAIPIDNTNDDVLYHSERFGNFTYQIPVSVSGVYDIRLHFAETFFGVEGNTGGTGDRVFNVTIEGEEVLSNFDVLAETNPATALIKEFDDVLIADGLASFEFTGVINNAFVSGIEILSPDAFTPVPSVTILSPSEGWDVNQPFEVAFSTKNWNIAVGDTHMHYFIDGVMVGPHYTYDPIIIDGLSEGSHTIRLELYNANHSGTGVFDEVTVNVTNTLVCNDAPFPDEWVVRQLETTELDHRAVYIYPEYDLDGDGLKDIVTGAWWYKNPGAISGEWVRSDIGAPFNNVAHVYDFDGDGDLDLLGTQGDYLGSDMAWAENDGSGNFTVRTNIDSGATTFSEPFLAGIAGGVFDQASGYQIAINWNGAESTGSPMQLLTIPADPINQQWTFSTLSPDSLGEDINAGDIDGDGDLDLFQGGNWLENDLDDSGTWITHSTGITYVTTFDRSQLVDIDRDGDLDAFVGQLGNGTNPDRFEFAWFEAPDDPTQAWTKNVIATDVEGSLSVLAADMDFDGDQDVIVGEWLGNNELFGFENDLCNSGGWITNTIDAGGTGFDHHDGARVVDIDNDGDLDIVSIGWNTIIPRIFENKTINADDPVNIDPLVLNPGIQLVDEGAVVQLQIDASDPNAGDVLTYSATNLPSDLTIDSTTGLISGTSTAAPGTYSVTVRATDQEGGFGETTFDFIIGDFAPLIRINAGGPDVTFGSEEWVEDIYFNDGLTFSTDSEIANTENDAIYQTERFSENNAATLTYEIPVPSNGTYGVRLHFAEIFFNEASARVFDVDIENGEGTLVDYDIIPAANASFTAVIETFLVTVNDGTLSIVFTDTIEAAKISGIELLGNDANVAPDVINPGNQTIFSNSDADIQIVANDIGDVLTYSAEGLPAELEIDAATGVISGTATDQLGDYSVTVRATDQDDLFDEETFTLTIIDFPNPLFINAGGPAVDFNDENWIADQYFTGGTDDFSVTDPIAATENDEIYQTERFGSAFSYEVAVPNNTEYEVRLHFSENFFTTSGSRVFDVAIEDGQAVLVDYDIYSAAGEAAFTAVVESLIVTVTDGNLSINFTSDVNNAKISGIEIIRRQPPVAVPIADPEVGEVPLIVNFSSDQSTDDGNIVSFEWDFMDGTTSTDANPEHTFTEVGVYDVTLTVTDNQGFTNTAIVTVTVAEPNTVPTAVITADPLTGTAPLEVSFTGDQSTDDGTIVSYEWDFKDGTTATETNPTHTFTTAGTYDVTLTVTDDQGLTNVASVTIEVTEPINTNEAPVAIIQATPVTGTAPLGVAFTGSVSTDDAGVVLYSWDFGDGTGSSEADPSYVYENAGSYQVTLTVEDAEGLSDTESITIEVNGSSSSETSIAVLIAPNPASEIASISLVEMPENVIVTNIHLSDSSGRYLGTFDPQEVFAGGAYQIPVGTLRNELYYVTLEFNNGDPIVLRLLVRN